MENIDLCDFIDSCGNIQPDSVCVQHGIVAFNDDSGQSLVLWVVDAEFGAHSDDFDVLGDHREVLDLQIVGQIHGRGVEPTEGRKGFEATAVAYL